MKSLIALIALTLSTANAAQHGASTFSTLKYPANFTHFDYANPDAPKGGDLNLVALGTFDSLNPFIIMGTPAVALEASCSMTFATLLAQAHDEVMGMYAYVASSVEIAADRSSVIFNLNPKAQFDNGEVITSDDVIFSFEVLRDKGQPLFRNYYKGVSKVEKLSDHAVKFHLTDTKSRELPVILGQLPILSKKFFSVRDFSKQLVTPAPSSGPYRIAKSDFGRRIVYERVKNWWGENLPSQKGQHNFDRITVDYYRDSTAMFEAFKAGKAEFRHENSAKLWATGYDFDAAKKGLVKRDLTEHNSPQPTQGFAFNLRKSIFADWRIRKALSDLFDFTWLNKNIFNDQYTRSQSIFPNAPFSQQDVPTGAEHALLSSFKEKISADILTTPITLPAHKNTAETRNIRQESLALLAKAGWHLVDGKLVNTATKKPFVFEFLNADPAMEKIALHFKRSLAEIGIDMTIRTLDVGSYTERVHEYDYDMIMMGIGQSITPGNEQRTFWGSKAADQKGGMNYTGIKDPVVDDLCEKIADAANYEELTTAAKALDRVLMHLNIMIPHWYRGKIAHAYWDRFGKPATHPNYWPFIHLSSWWVDPAKDQAIQAALGNPRSKNQSSGTCLRIIAWFKGLFQ